MKQIITEVFELDELTKEAREKAREWYRDMNDMPFLSEYMQEKLQMLLEEHGMKCKDADIQYSLGYCQGDGAMFSGRVEWTHGGREYTAIVKHSGPYSHYNSKTIELFRDENGGADIEEADEKTYKAFNEAYVKICGDLERAGYQYMEEENADGNVDDVIRSNGYTFTASGVRFG